MRVHKWYLFLLAALFYSLPSLHAQAAPAAIGFERRLWAGVEGSNFQNDYVKYIRSDGFGFYADYLISKRIGVEAELRFLDLNSVQGLTEKTYLAGPIINAYQYHHFSFYGKALLGIAAASYPPTPLFSKASGSYFSYEIGGGVEYRLNSRFKLRGEYDQQFWPSAPGPEIAYPRASTGLTPKGFSAGVSYRIF